MAMVFAMVVIGGLTRLTESGLSIVEWRPVAGTLPPLSDAAWQMEFEKYQTSPQYKKINKGMTLEQFQGIFWLEYIHRLWGRLIGLVYLLPLLYFSLFRSITGMVCSIPRPLFVRFWTIAALIGFQGALGWIMVASGLVDQPMVSPVRLAAHLLTAFLIYGLMLWSWLDLRFLPPPLRGEVARRAGGGGLFSDASTSFSDVHPLPNPPPSRGREHSRLATLLLAAVCTQVMLGGLVAGNDAGLSYNTFPLMDGHIAPPGMWVLQPGWRNLLENTATIQFLHRCGAYVVTALTLVFWWRARRDNELKKLADILACTVLAQFSLGVFTLIHQVPVALASLHQAFALILFTLCVIVRHRLTHIKPV